MLVRISTSKGTQKIAEKHASLVKKGDVISETKIAVTRIKPVDDGVHFQEAVCVDPAGSLPQFVKDFIAKGNSSGLKKLIE